MGFTFIDLFCGIGGMRLGMESAGGRCVFSSDWDRFARQTYEANFGEEPAGDIREIRAEDIKDHDVLAAGFPCQPFSISGVSKKNSLGKPHGFADQTQGTLFFEIARIIKVKRPKAFLLENVKNLASHDQGRTLRVIREVLERELGYYLHVQVVDARPFVPQHRERIYLVGFREPRRFEIEMPKTKPPIFQSILEKNPDDRYVLTAHLWTYLKNYAAKHRAAGHGFGYGLVDLKGHSRTLSARYYKDGSEILIPRGPRRNPRRLTPRECANLMGFPRSFKIPVSDTQAYKQFGNSVAVPLVSAIAQAMVRSLGERPVSVPRQANLLEAV